MGKIRKDPQKALQCSPAVKTAKSLKQASIIALLLFCNISFSVEQVNTLIPLSEIKSVKLIRICTRILTILYNVDTNFSKTVYCAFKTYHTSSKVFIATNCNCKFTPLYFRSIMVHEVCLQEKVSGGQTSCTLCSTNDGLKFGS